MDDTGDAPEQHTESKSGSYPPMLRVGLADGSRMLGAKTPGLQNAVATKYERVDSGAK